MFSVWASLTNNRMASGFWCKVILLVVLASLMCRATAAADCYMEGKSCDQCYQTLANYLVNTGDNKYYLRKVFYPLEKAAPVFVTVIYQYIYADTNNTYNTTTNIYISNISNTSIWYWSAGGFYFLQPLRVFQFTSLLFGNPELRNSELNVTLPAECVTAPVEFMTELTQLVRTMTISTIYIGISDVHSNTVYVVLFACTNLEEWEG